jgi:KaiC/GvpD/RAD55 family RecA-like ATPase
LYVLSNFEEPRTRLFYIYEFLRELGMTSMLVSEMPADMSRYCEYGVEDFLADAVIVLKMVERHRKVTRELNIAKMRATDCNSDIFSLEFKNGKFKVMYGGQTPLI